MLELLQSVKRFRKKTPYYLQQCVSCSGKVKISKEHASQTRMPSETFYTTSSLQENSFFSQMRTGPHHTDPCISHFQAKLSQLTVIRSENGSNFFKISIQAWQNTAAFLPARLAYCQFTAQMQGSASESPKCTFAVASRSQQGWQWGKTQLHH